VSAYDLELAEELPGIATHHKMTDDVDDGRCHAEEENRHHHHHHERRRTYHLKKQNQKTDFSNVFSGKTYKNAYVSP
jgi:hypothetical protein